MQSCENPPENHSWGKLEEGESIPSLKAFEDQIIKYRTLQDQVHDLPSSKVMGWLKCNAKSAKNALAILISKWSYKFLEYLLHRVTSSAVEASLHSSKPYESADISLRQASLCRATKQLMPKPRGRRPPPTPGEGLVYRTMCFEGR